MPWNSRAWVSPLNWEDGVGRGPAHLWNVGWQPGLHQHQGRTESSSKPDPAVRSQRVLARTQGRQQRSLHGRRESRLLLDRPKQSLLHQLQHLQVSHGRQLRPRPKVHRCSKSPQLLYVDGLALWSKTQVYLREAKQHARWLWFSAWHDKKRQYSVGKWTFRPGFIN